MSYKLTQGDCLEVMRYIPDNSVDLILCDLPYGTTSCKWDAVIPFDLMWEQYRRITKDSGNVVLTASQPFTSALVMSNLQDFKYEWVWEKAVGSNFAAVKYQPMKEHESVLVFGKGRSKYNPQMQPRKGNGAARCDYSKTISKTPTAKGEFYSPIDRDRDGKQYAALRNPSSVQFFNNREGTRGLHPTQKPVALMEYLVKTYTDQGDTVLDNCMGSGTTGVACAVNSRAFIGIENNDRYFDIARGRVAAAYGETN